MEKKFDTREGWLNAAISLLDRKYFHEHGYELPEKLAVSCGFPKSSNKAIGQCWDSSVSEDETTHMFISPRIADRVEVLATLLHEMIHASIGIDAGHGALFRKLARQFGLAGKMTATYAADESELFMELDVIAGRLGPYPHAPMVPENKAKKKSAGPIRLKSVNDENFKVTISPKVLETYGFPKDYEGDDMVPVDVVPDPDEEEADG